jgi:hypothetical protein
MILVTGGPVFIGALLDLPRWHSLRVLILSAARAKPTKGLR